MAAIGSRVGRPLLDGLERVFRLPTSPVSGDVVRSFQLEWVSPDRRQLPRFNEDAQLDPGLAAVGLAIPGDIINEAKDSLMSRMDVQDGRGCQRAIRWLFGESCALLNVTDQAHVPFDLVGLPAGRQLSRRVVKEKEVLVNRGLTDLEVGAKVLVNRGHAIGPADK